jgi:hypothetical protein
MQTAVNERASLGEFPDCKRADVETPRRFEEAIASLKRPLHDDEARALAVCFGPDDCFGPAWVLAHAIHDRRLQGPAWAL